MHIQARCVTGRESISIAWAGKIDACGDGIRRLRRDRDCGGDRGNSRADEGPASEIGSSGFGSLGRSGQTQAGQLGKPDSKCAFE